MGLFQRHLYDSIYEHNTTVASTCRHPKLVIYYTDYHDVDEDLKTIPIYGGWWTSNDMAGISERNVRSTPFNTYDYVASSDI